MKDESWQPGRNFMKEPQKLQIEYQAPKMWIAFPMQSTVSSGLSPQAVACRRCSNARRQSRRIREAAPSVVGRVVSLEELEEAALSFGAVESSGAQSMQISLASSVATSALRSAADERFAQ